MSRRVATTLTVLGVMAGLGLAATILQARDARYPAPPPTERLLYLRSGRVADRLMRSFDGLAADIYWIRAIQHFGRDRKSGRDQGRFELLEPLLDLTTTLDPRFNIAYRFGAIFFAMPTGPAEGNGPGRPDLAIKLLEKGLKNNPNRWLYAHDAGFVHYWFTGDYLEASRWFERAAAMPGAPPWLKPLAATTRVQGGDRASARAMLQELGKSEERYIRNAAMRLELQLRALDEIDALNGQVQAYFARFKVYPRGFMDRWMTLYPQDPSGTPYAYDPATHTVSLSPTSPLNPLPAALARTPPPRVAK